MSRKMCKKDKKGKKLDKARFVCGDCSAQVPSKKMICKPHKL